MSGSDVNEGKAVRIVDVEKDGKLTLHLDDVKLITDKIKKMPVIVVSVAGSFGLGKSFLLNMFLRYLDRYEKNPKHWIGDNEEDIGSRFAWQGGGNVVTRGILMWSEPYTRIIGGKKVAVLLIDTQGNFDLQTDPNGNYKIFALSTLMSSIQLHNVSMKLRKDTFDYLQAFLTYAISCNSDKAERFQTLLFVVRDWRKTKERPYGLDGGRLYLNTECSDSLEKGRKSGPSINQSFTEVECCLLPLPGTAVHDCENSDELKVKDIDERFVEQVGDLARWIFSNPSCVKKMVSENVEHHVDGEGLYEYLKLLQQRINSEDLPPIRAISEYIIVYQCEEKMKKMIDLFEDKTKALCEKIYYGDLIPWEELREAFRNYEEKVLNEFNNCYGVRTPIHDEKQRSLQDHMENVKNKMIAGNKENEKITKECTTQKETAIEIFRNLVHEHTETLKEGYPIPRDEINNDLQHAYQRALDHFDEADGSGTRIHKRLKTDLRTWLDKTKTGHQTTNRNNQETYKDYKQECEKIKKKLEERLDEVHDCFTDKNTLKREYEAAIRELPPDKDTEATITLRDNNENEMNKIFENHKKSWAKREKIKDGACVTGAVVLLVSGICCSVVAPLAAPGLYALGGVCGATPIGRRAYAWMEHKWGKKKLG